MRVRAADRIFDVDGIVFDKDGTLIDLESYWLEAARVWVEVAGGDDHRAALAASLGLENAGLVPDGPLATASFTDLVELTERTLRERGVDDAVGLALQAAARATELVERAVPQPIGDVFETFRRLAGAGFDLAIATTDETGTTLQMLETLGIDRFVSIVLTGDGEGPFKPDARVLGEIARRWGTTPQRVLMVGDSERDRATAANAGAAGFVLVATTPRIPADVTVTSVDQIVPADDPIDP